MTLRILGRKNSVNVMKVLWACDELDIAWSQEDIGGPFGGNDTDEYLRLNPNGRIPTIEHNGMNLWESNVIVRCLAAQYPDHANCLLPKTTPMHWVAEQWMDWQQTTIHGSMTVVFWGLVRTPVEERDNAAIDDAVQKLGAAWNLLDKHLQTMPYIAGDQLSMGDIPLGCFVHRWFELDIPRPKLPALEAWYQRLLQRTSYTTHVSNPMT